MAASIKGANGQPISDRQVRRAIRFLRERGHLRQENGRGTPKMFPLYRAATANSEAAKVGHKVGLRSDIRSDMVSGDVGHHVRDGRTSCPPNLLVLKPSTQTISSPTPPSGAEPSGIAGLGDVDAHGLGDAADLLRARLGPEVFGAWFSKVAIEKIADQVVTITAPTKFIRDWIAYHFAGQVLASLQQAVGVAINAVEIVVRA